MSKTKIYLCRHGETDWSRSGQHTGTTDIALTKAGEEQAIKLGNRLKGVSFDQVLISPRKRAQQTAKLAGCTGVTDDDLVEWDYGEYEGLTTPQIRQKEGDWSVFTHGCPGGESVEAMQARVDRVIARLLEQGGDIAVFSHGHFSRAIAVRWLGLPLAAGSQFGLDTASLSILGYVRESRALLLWNEISFLN